MRRRRYEERGERGRDWEEEDEGYERDRGMYGYPFGQQHGQPYGWREREIAPFGYEQGRGEEERDYPRRWEERERYEGRGYGPRDYERRRWERREWDPRDYQRRRTWDEPEEPGLVERAMEKVGRFFGKGPKGYRRSDERIKEDVCETLWRDPHVDASEIEVEVKNGEVVLRGTVDSRMSKRRAEDIIEHISGVTDVHNQLRVVRQETMETRMAGDNGRRTQPAGQTPRNG